MFTINKDKNAFNGIILVEVYEDLFSLEIHKNSPTTQAWRDTVEPYMNTARQVTTYESF